MAQNTHETNDKMEILLNLNATVVYLYICTYYYMSNHGFLPPFCIQNAVKSMQARN